MIFGVGAAFVVLTGGIDLSVGAGMALFGVIAATLRIDHGWAAGPAIVIALAASVLIGLWHGFLVARLRIPPFIATLSGFLAYAAARWSSPRRARPVAHGLRLRVPRRRIGAAPATAVCILGFAVGIAILIRRDRRRRSFDLPVEPRWALVGAGPRPSHGRRESRCRSSGAACRCRS